MSYINKLIDAIILIVLGSVAGFVLVSMVMTFYYHGNGTLEWDKLGEIGEFWGGHLNSIALIFLGMTLFVQRDQFLQQKVIDEASQARLKYQMDMLTAEHRQQVLHFGLEQLRAESSILNFKVLTWGESDNNNKVSPQESGIPALHIAWKKEQDVSSEDKSVFVLLANDEFQNYIQLASRAQNTIKDLDGPSVEMCQSLLSIRAPAWLWQLDLARKSKVQQSIDFFTAHCPEDLEGWLRMVEQGWRLDTDYIASGGAVVCLYRDHYHAPQRLILQGSFGDAIETVLRRDLPRVIAATRIDPLS